MSHLILVLGFHRSGTSVITKSLECLGVSLGDHANWSAPDNPSGFWEDLDIMALNERLLLRYASAWDDPVLDLSRPVMLSDLKAYAERILRDKLDRFPLFGLKDPRMCRLLPFWRQIFERIGCNVSAVVVTRNFSAVSASLWKRNAMGLEAAQKLYNSYMDGLARHMDDKWPAALIPDFLDQPEASVRLIGTRLGLKVDEDKLKWFLDEFIRH